MLCEICQKIDYDQLYLDPKAYLKDYNNDTYRHQRNYSALSRAASLGCEFCAGIMKDIEATRDAADKLLKDQMRSKQMFLMLSKADDYGYTNLTVYCKEKDDSRSELASFGLFIQRTAKEWETGLCESTNISRTIISGRDIACGESSDECFKLATAWINRCLGNTKDTFKHVLCNVQPQNSNPLRYGDSSQSIHIPGSSFLPTRTINVGPPDGSCQPFLAINANKDFITKLARSTPYVTLSHRWGDSKPLTTTLDTLEDRKKAIPLEILPQTFRDAVVITRKLGSQHLWIDSLCIIQDSKEDWACEAAKMADVYRHSFVNIAAEAAENCHAGIFKQRSQNFVELPFKSAKHGINGRMFVRPLFDNFTSSITRDENVLSQRAWVLQESLLSPRTIHYGRQQMFWECRESTLSESDISTTMEEPCWEISEWDWIYNKRFLDISGSSAADRNSSAKSDATSRIERETLYRRWYSVVTNYSQRQLTFPSDVFPALAGLATVFQDGLGDRYFAGLFSGDFLRGLLWKVRSPDWATRPLEYRAPSWSWASIIGSLTGAPELPATQNMFWECDSENIGVHTATILDAETTPSRVVDGDQRQDLGQVSGGHLIIRGQWLRASYRSRSLTGWNYHPRVFDAGSINYWYDGSDKDFRGVLDINDDLETDDTQYLPCLDGEGFFHLGTWLFKPSGKNEGVKIWVALLLKPTDEALGIYQRIGIVHLEVPVTYEEDEDEAQKELYIPHGWVTRTVKII